MPTPVKDGQRPGQNELPERAHATAANQIVPPEFTQYIAPLAAAFFSPSLSLT
jgi:hypothetical protein